MVLFDMLFLKQNYGLWERIDTVGFLEDVVNDEMMGRLAQSFAGRNELCSKALLLDDQFGNYTIQQTKGIATIYERGIPINY